MCGLLKHKTGKNMKTPKILILYKQSTYKHYFLDSSGMSAQARKSSAIEKRFINTHLEHYRTLTKVEAFLKKNRLKYKKMQRGRTKDFSGFDLVITIGGDGTFLEAASVATTQMMLGINSDPKWSVGRFCLGNSSNFDHIILNILANKHKICPLNRMNVLFVKSKQAVTVLNDILVCHSNPAAMSRYYLELNAKGEEQRSSGVWIATAAGSTGAIRSAGGIVLDEKSKDLQFVVREPYCGKTRKISHRCGIFNDKSHLKITSLMPQGIVYFDGSHTSIPFTFGEELRVQISKYPLNLVTA